MTPSIPQAAPASAKVGASAAETGVLVVLAVLWGQLFASLSTTWKEGTYYSFGWFVAPIAVAFFWRRWRLRPSSAEVRLFTTPSPSWFGIIPCALLLAAILLFARITFADSPGWRLPAWGHAVLVAGVHHAILARAAGWATSVDCLPVTLFALCAVPYPMRLEVPLVHSLAEMVTAVCREVFLLTGVPVSVRGEQLSLEGQSVAVTDGCSGLRSIQSLLMAGLFFGELFWLTWPRRLILVTIAMGAAVITNVGRALWLARTNFHHGEAAMDRWHDAAGHTAFALGCALLLGAAFGLHPRSRRSVVRRSATPSA